MADSDVDLAEWEETFRMTYESPVQDDAHKEIVTLLDSYKEQFAYQDESVQNPRPNILDESLPMSQRLRMLRDREVDREVVIGISRLVHEDQKLAETMLEILSEGADTGRTAVHSEAQRRCAVREIVRRDTDDLLQRANVVAPPLENKALLFLLRDFFEISQHPNPAEIALFAWFGNVDENVILSWFEEERLKTNGLFVLKAAMGGSIAAKIKFRKQ